jgi:reprolysin-like metallo-peptidase family M12B
MLTNPKFRVTAILEKNWLVVSVLFCLSLFVGVIPVALSQQCFSTLGGFAIGTAEPAGDGRFHFKYRFRDESGNNITPSNAMQTAMNQAAANWNVHSATTQVVFEAAGANEYADIVVIPTTDTAKTQGCASMDTAFNYIYYDPALDLAAQSSTANGATVLAHELGHFLGLRDANSNNPSPPTIMNNPAPGQTCQNFTVPTIAPRSNDATRVASCITQSQNQTTAHQYHRQEPDYSYYPAACWSFYLVTDHYSCLNDSCSYRYSDWEFMYSECD